MIADYFLFVFLVLIGVLQLIAAWMRLDGLSFFTRRYVGYIFAAAITCFGYGWFFRVDRNLPDYAGGMSGPQLFYILIIAFAAAIILTLIVSSVVKVRWSGPSPQEDEKGIDALKRMTYFQAIKRGLWQKRFGGKR